MKLPPRLLATLSLSIGCLIAACDPGTAGPPTEPSDPTKTGYEAPGGDTDSGPGVGGSIDQLCSFVCTRFANTCPMTIETNCPTQCASSVANFPMCESVFRTFLQCLTTAPLDCSNGGVAPTVCIAETNAVSNCMSGISGTAGTGGGTKL